MQLEILTPEHKVFSGDVYGVQLPGVEGSFEILQNHAPMVAALGVGKMKILKDKSNTETYQINGGFVETLNNKTTVLLEGAEAVSY
ncbi:ATP synthase F1 subunit epsilon [Taibaiella chishuiensis]|uniref:ATP synthase F1 subcomplex epsilon subunit n=1 Tax=Taibaiella chishuiensis TaxID=1434707 RepID=A0A2P8D1K1_9BACT|nr:ATP synthase F1 subunit epsilon [Taibaiella chishuiensis]PSK91085.1 ATP synthase F1 subcomplex epsilon subunit [Taibaiella chishuiensis]